MSENKPLRQVKYDKVNTKTFTIKLNKKTDKDILSYIDMQDNKQGFIKELIRQEIKRKA